jgi:FkbM family methyltransferase
VSSLRERIKRVPVAGPALYDFYLKRRFNEGEVLTIQGGPLRGHKFKRFMRTYFDGYVTGAFEPELLARIASELEDGDVFFDIGANDGLMSMAGAQGVGATGTVIAFEPHPKTADELREQMRINKIDHIVQVEEVALSGEDGLIEFSDDGPSDMLGIASIADQTSVRTIMVPSARLDSLMDRLGPPRQ